MDMLGQLLDVFLHLDTHLNDWAGALGPWLYVVLFLIIFCETGLVVTPFLPGDSLLFAVGALASVDGSPIEVISIILTLIVAAVLGDAVNYSVGYRVGPHVFRSKTSWLLNHEHLMRTQYFYEKHGGKTIILARFMPIIRTFAPFVAGVGKMSYSRFGMFNITGGVIWVIAFVMGGYLFGNVPVVKRNFHVVIIAIVILSVMPPVIEYLRSRGRAAPSPARD